jgi:ribosomal protein S18 acetylase RimI-like enzyme
MYRDEKKSDIQFGHVTSLAVARTHRKLGIASKLMCAARTPQRSMCCLKHTSAA